MSMSLLSALLICGMRLPAASQKVPSTWPYKAVQQSNKQEVNHGRIQQI